jgi:hypothetical protein
MILHSEKWTKKKLQPEQNGFESTKWFWLSITSQVTRGWYEA